MTTAIATPRAVAAPPSGRSRARLARLERPLLLAGLALVALHLLDLAFSGPATAVLGVLAIVAVPTAWALSQPHVIRPTRLVLGVVIGLMTVGFGVVSHGLHVVNSGPDWTDVTGVGMIAGGLLLIASGLAAVAGPRRPPRRSAPGWRAAHAAGWLSGAVLIALCGVMPLLYGLIATHAPRWAIQESSLGIPHQEVAIATADGRELSGWYVPSRNGAAVLLSHGSGGSRERVVAHLRMLARHGYGVLALDNPGNGESEGHSNGFGYNAQPAVDAALAWLAAGRTSIPGGSPASAPRSAPRCCSRPPRATIGCAPSSATAPRGRPMCSGPQIRRSPNASSPSSASRSCAACRACARRRPWSGSCPASRRGRCC